LKKKLPLVFTNIFKKELTGTRILGKAKIKANDETIEI